MVGPIHFKVLPLFLLSPSSISKLHPLFSPLISKIRYLFQSLTLTLTLSPMATYQILVKHLDGHTGCLQFPSPTVTGQTLRQALAIAPNLRLVTGTLEIADETQITASSPSNLFPSLTLLPRLCGGKGGFGSLLRGAATKAGQKKTNNFDACRDMSGRRLRHVNAEKKLEEWKAEAEDRRLEKLAVEFLKKKAKEIKKEKGKNGEVEKYLEKYRKDSEKCMEAVEESVRESFALYQEGKRKVLPAAGGSASKRMKIWLGKKKVEESDSDDEDEDDREKSVVLDDGNCTMHGKEEEGTSAAGLISASSDGESSGKFSEKSNFEKVIGVSGDEHSSGGNSDTCNLCEVNGKCDVESPATGHDSVNGDSNTESNVSEGAEIEVTEEAAAAAASSVASSFKDFPARKEFKPAPEISVAPEIIDKETAVQTADCSNLEEPLVFDKYNFAVELEVLGMERLKAELQSHGLKCGGTLQERAARLFLLKTTPLEKLPKKVLASKTGGK